MRPTPEMGITDREEELFGRWSTNRKGLIRDGVVDESAYLASCPRIMLVLKEVNDKENDGWDLRKYLRGQPKAATWNAVTRWVKGIRALPKVLPWVDLKPKPCVEDRVEAVRSLCVMNLKKVPGLGSADMEMVKSVAMQDQVYLREQFALYDPDLVICCGTSKLFQRVLPGEVEGLPKWKMTQRGVFTCKLNSGPRFIEFFHPQVRWKPSMVHYALIDAVRELYPDGFSD